MLSLLALVQQVPRSGVTTIPRDTLFRIQDTLAAAAGSIHDTLTTPPLPGGVAIMVRTIFGVPRWIQIGGAILAVLVGIVVVGLLWTRRARIIGWLRTRSRQIQLTLAGSALVLVCVAAFAGKKSWDYMQHDNGFCTGCHVMERPFGRFEQFAGKHEDRKCHDCHQQSIFASGRQLVLWVANRPNDIGKHAPVPNSRCESCHQVVGGREPWQHALRLAGHRVHFESDSAVLRGLTCVKCHGAEIHHFIPANRTCQQSGCHEQQSVRLAGMTKLPTISCVTCHAFRADLPGLATYDSAVRALVPAKSQCLSCHGMQGRPSGYVTDKDPHKGSCGSCHDVHTDTRATDARTSCVKCHAAVAQNPFHSGANHRRVAAQCLVCHEPHAASVDASDCVGCHTAVQRRGQFHPPLPFDTAAVLRRRIAGAATQSLLEHAGETVLDHRGKGDALPEQPPSRDSPIVRADLSADSFPHSRHTSLPCLTCHAVNTGNRLVFEVPRGCDLCHHQSLMAGTVSATDCARCHTAAKLAAARPMIVGVGVAGKPPVARTVGFRHEVHQQTPCAACHQPPNIVPPDSIRSCQACHAQHHEAQRTCTACHNRPETPPAHSRTTHVGCDECHTPSRIAALTPSRTFCLTCHAAQQAHLPGRECTTCHFLATPAEFQPRLMKAGTE